MKNFNGRPFFSLFFIARANQKIPNLALGLQSRLPARTRSECNQWAQPPYGKKLGPAGWSLYVNQPAGLKIERPTNHCDSADSARAERAERKDDITVPTRPCVATEVNWWVDSVTGRPDGDG
jgi:hypothetical protein